MTNYEKAMELLNLGIARKHYTFYNGKTGCIVIDLGGAFVGFITRYDDFVDVAQGGEHVYYGDIDLEDMMVLDTSNRHRYNLPINKWEDAQWFCRPVNSRPCNNNFISSWDNSSVATWKEDE